MDAPQDIACKVILGLKSRSICNATVTDTLSYCDVNGRRHHVKQRQRDCEKISTLIDDCHGSMMSKCLFS